MNQLTRRDFLRLCGTSSIGLALAACGVTPTPTATPAPTSTSLPTSTTLPTATAPLTNTPPLTSTPTPTSTLTPSVTPSPKPTPIPAESVDFHRNDIASLSDDFLRSRGNYPWVGDYAIGIHHNVAPDTIIERFPSYKQFDGPVLHVKIGSSPPPDTSDNQRAYVNFERLPNRQIREPWGYEFSILVLNVPNKLENTGWNQAPIYNMTSLLMHLPDAAFRSAGGVRLFSEGDKYYVSVYRVNRPGEPISTFVDSRKIFFEIGAKHAIRAELFYNPQDGGRPYLRAFLFNFDSDGKRTGYQYIGELPLDSDIKEILGDITWLGAYVGSPVRNLEVIVGEAKVFIIK